jgi:hypothetical protein
MTAHTPNYGPVRYADTRLKGCECERPIRDGLDCFKCGRPLQPAQQHITPRYDKLGRRITPHGLD